MQMIKQNFRIPKTFSFQPVSKDEVKKIIKDLKNSKSVRGEIPTKILKECEFTFEALTQCVNKSFGSGEFPGSLKQANVSPIFNPFSVKFIKWPNTLKQFDRKLPTSCLSVFDHFSGLGLKGLRKMTL